MKPIRTFTIVALAALSYLCFAQNAGTGGAQPATPAAPKTNEADEAAKAAARARAAKLDTQRKQWEMMRQDELEGTPVRVKDIAHFRGLWSNQLTGFGIVTGLDGTGDSKKFSPTLNAFSNILKKSGFDIDTSSFDTKNIAMVSVTATLPPFASLGQQIDVTVSTLGDCKSLRGGTLLYSVLKAPGEEGDYATASGPISVGGFSIAAGGNNNSKGFVTVGRIPGGAIVQKTVATATVFNGKMYLDLDDQDVTTAHRIEERINAAMPEMNAVALNGGTVQITLPLGMSATTAQAKLQDISVQSDTVAKIVINERTGTIVVGGNVRVGPCAVAKGSISVSVQEDLTVSQPNPLSDGVTVGISNKKQAVTEEQTNFAVMRPNTTVADLAAIFQALHLKASDIIDILQSMRSQGALKAKLVLE